MYKYDKKNMLYIVYLSVIDIVLSEIWLWLNICMDNIKRYDMFVKTGRRKEV